jgi:hypothetical protein
LEDAGLAAYLDGLVVDDAPTCGHPEHIARVQLTLIAIDEGALQDQGHGFNARMRMSPTNLAAGW